MAIVRFTNGKDESIDTETGSNVWAVLNGEQEPTQEQNKFMRRVANVHLNWRSAPDSYIKSRLQTLLPIVLGEWSCDYSGNLIRPGNDIAWQFAKRWGLWENGRPSVLVQQHNERRRYEQLDFSRKEKRENGR